MGRLRLLDVGPDGLEKWFEYDPITKTKTIHYKQPDIEPVLEYTNALRKCSEYSREGIKKGWWHYAHIPNIVIIKLRTEYGLNIWNRNHEKRIWQVINSDFPYLKVTEKMHQCRQ